MIFGHWETHQNYEAANWRGFIVLVPFAVLLANIG